MRPQVLQSKLRARLARFEWTTPRVAAARLQPPGAEAGPSAITAVIPQRFLGHAAWRREAALAAAAQQDSDSGSDAGGDAGGRAGGRAALRSALRSSTGRLPETMAPRPAWRGPARAAADRVCRAAAARWGGTGGLA
jgi:hypothetical protein